MVSVAAAEAADFGLLAAERAASDDATQAANRTPHDAAALATAALAALDHLAPNEAGPLAARLVATVLTSAASATASHELASYDSRAEQVASANWLERGIAGVRVATRQLLAHKNPAGRRGAYAALAAAAEISLAPAGDADGQGPDAAARAVSNAARAVMLGADVVGEIVAGGLGDANTRVYAAKLLNCIAACAGASDLEAQRAAISLLPWLPYLECDLDDETAGPAVSAAAAAAVRAAPKHAWTPLEPLLRGLFHRHARRRAAAAEGLARALGLTPDLPAPAKMPTSLSESARAWIDPFGGVLRHADYSRKRGGEVTNGDVGDSDVPLFVDCLTSPSRPSILSSVFEPTDVDELFQVLVGDQRLGPSVRCAAADQLCVCVGDSRLELELVKPNRLAAVARIASDGLTKEGPDLDVASSCLKFLAAAVSRSRRARVFFAETADVTADGNGSTSAPSPYGRAVALLPLAFHPRVSIRERLAVFVSYVLFGSVADAALARVGGGGVSDGGVPLQFTLNASLSLPTVLTRQLTLPVRVVEISNEFRGDDAATSPKADEHKVRAMLTQKREVRRLGGAVGALGALELAMMDDLLHDAEELQGQHGGNHQSVNGAGKNQNAKIADAQLRWASPSASAMTSLARLASARSHQDAVAAVAALRGVLSFGNPGAAAIVSAAWPEGAMRILTKPPKTPGDARLWSLLVTGTALGLSQIPRLFSHTRLTLFFYNHSSCRRHAQIPSPCV